MRHHVPPGNENEECCQNAESRPSGDYGTLDPASILALIMALAAPDRWDAIEAQVAAVYLTLLIGSNKAFNAKSVFGHQKLGSLAAFIATGLLPATIIYVAVAQIEPDQSAHLATLYGFGVVTAGTAFLTYLPSHFALEIWLIVEERQRQRMIKATPSWVPRLN